MKRRVLVLSLAVLAAAGCGSTRTVTVTSTRTVTTTRTVTAPSPAPAGFAPVSFTAVSDDEFWLLGNRAIEHTADGGASFARIDLPPLSGLGQAGVSPTLRFADARDGWLLIPGNGAAIYATHDGGGAWTHLGIGSVVGFAVGGGYAYALTADCTANSCTAYRFRRTPVAQDAWTDAPAPFAPAGAILDLEAHGADVWLLGTRGSQGLLAHSTNAGATFSVAAGPCTPGLGGDIQAVSATVLWAVCPTGMLAGAWRSTDGGRTFAALHTKELANSSVLAPASATTAVIVSGNEAQRTTDGGATWSTPDTPSAKIAWTWAGFTDARVGTAIVGRQLWRTSDGGASWHVLTVG